MVLALAAVFLLLWGVAAQRLRLDPAARRRVMLIGVATAGISLLLFSLRMVPFGVLAMLVGIGFAGNVVMRQKSGDAGFEDLARDGPPPPAKPRGAMAREEALAVLGLDGEPDEAAIHAAHKRMILRAHPDQGGSDYLAAKVNEARQVLLPKD